MFRNSFWFWEAELPKDVCERVISNYFDKDTVKEAGYQDLEGNLIYDEKIRKNEIAWAHPESGRNHQRNCPRPENSDGCEDKSPNAIAIKGHPQSNHRANKWGCQIHERRLFEIQIPGEHPLGEDQGRRR